jgi:oxygen-independent coproporphyrinogen-3 oxidase
MALDDALDTAMLEAAVAEGYLLWDGARLAATPEGRVRLNALLAAIVA